MASQNVKDYKALARALRHVERLSQFDLDGLLKLVSGPNQELLGLHLRIQNRLRFLQSNDPDCCALSGGGK